MNAIAFQPTSLSGEKYGSFSYTEDELINNELGISKELLQILQENYFNEFVYKSATYIFNEVKFFGLYNSWLNKTRFISDVDEIINDSSFLKIVEMGAEAIPFILNQLEKKPSKLVWALNKITNSKISNTSLSIDQASKLWVEWGQKRKLLK